MEDVRPSPIAGSWYPGDAQDLAASIDRQLKTVQPSPLPGELVGLIAPHAGHRYSGHVAAHAFRLLEDKQPQIVAIVSPLHYPCREKVLASAHRAYSTPLGEVPIDQDLLHGLAIELRQAAGLELTLIRHDQEHSLEIELPFIQRALGRPFRLLPVMLRDQSQSSAEALGHALAVVIPRQTYLLVASSDLSHFYPDEVARKLDAEIMARIEGFDPAGLLQAEEQGTGFACGKGAIAAVLWAAKDLGADRAQVIFYANSGDVTGDLHSVVGYAAAAICRSASA